MVSCEASDAGFRTVRLSFRSGFAAQAVSPLRLSKQMQTASSGPFLDGFDRCVIWGRTLFFGKSLLRQSFGKWHTGWLLGIADGARSGWTSDRPLPNWTCRWVLDDRPAAFVDEHLLRWDRFESGPRWTVVEELKPILPLSDVRYSRPHSQDCYGATELIGRMERVLSGTDV